MDEVVNKAAGQRGRSLERTGLERRKPGKRSLVRRSSSRKTHHPHYHQKLLGGNVKPLKTAAMVAVMSISPCVLVFLWYSIVHQGGSMEKTWRFMLSKGIHKAFREMWPIPTMRAVKVLGSFAIFEAVLQILVPGERYLGPSTPAGNRPVYTKNGVPCYLTTVAVYYLLWKEKWFSPASVYDMIGEIYSTLICTSYVVCILLFIKGRIAPSSSDWGSSGNILVDFFWGTELYPRITRHFDVKVFMNCRFGIMGWALMIISYAIKQFESQGKISDSLMVTSLLMLVYITKFFWTEAAFWSSNEIAHDRAGWFEIWSCITWIPTVYPAVNMYLVNHPIQLGRGVALTIFAAGMGCIYVVWDCDRQRQVFRHTHGKCRIWGKVPSKIQAHYQTEWGEHKQSLLLTAGWWGLARHIQYAPEIGAAFFWTLPALFSHGAPYFYVTFLTILLVDRAVRDDHNCKIKYHKYWEAYAKKVRFKIIPCIF